MLRVNSTVQLCLFLFASLFLIPVTASLSAVQSAQLLGNYVLDPDKSTIILGHEVDKAIEVLAQGDLSPTGALQSIKARNVSVEMTILLVDPETGIFAGYKTSAIPGVPRSRSVERLLGQAVAQENGEGLDVHLQGAEDSADWDGVLIDQKNGTIMDLTRIEGLEIWNENGELVDNQAASVLYFVKEEGDFDPIQAAQDILPLLKVRSNVVGEDYLSSNSHYSFHSLLSAVVLCLSVYVHAV